MRAKVAKRLRKQSKDRKEYQRLKKDYLNEEKRKRENLR